MNSRSILARVKMPFRDWTDAEWDAYISNTLANVTTIVLVLILISVWTRKRPKVIARIVEAS